MQSVVSLPSDLRLPFRGLFLLLNPSPIMSPLTAALAVPLAQPKWHRRGLSEYSFGEKVVRVHPDEDGADGFFVALFEVRARWDLGFTQHDRIRVRVRYCMRTINIVVRCE